MKSTKNTRNAENFSDRLREAMAKANVSQSDLARLLETAWSTVDRWMKGSIPRRKMIQEIASALGVASRWLEFGEGELSDPAAPTGASSMLSDHKHSYGKRDDDFLDDILRLAPTADLASLLDTMESLGNKSGTGNIRAGRTLALMIPIVRDRIEELKSKQTL